jgi:hypothetical protein
VDRNNAHLSLFVSREIRAELERSAVANDRSLSAEVRVRLRSTTTSASELPPLPPPLRLRGMTRRFDICLQGDVSWQILREVCLVMGEETSRRAGISGPGNAPDRAPRTSFTRPARASQGNCMGTAA